MNTEQATSVPSTSWSAAKVRRTWQPTIRAAVEELLEGADAPPTGLGALLPKLGVEKVTYRSDLPYSGLLERSESGGLRVICSTDQPAARKRFTVAHELGHAFLHGRRDLAEQLQPAEQEWFCDAFASELLMPESKVSEQVDGELDLRALLELSATFQTSLRATAITCAQQLGVSVILADARGRVWQAGPIQELDAHLQRTYQSVLASGQPIRQRLRRDYQGRSDDWILEVAVLEKRPGDALLLLRPVL